MAVNWIRWASPAETGSCILHWGKQQIDARVDALAGALFSFFSLFVFVCAATFSFDVREEPSSLNRNAILMFSAIGILHQVRWPRSPCHAYLQPERHQPWHCLDHLP